MVRLTDAPDATSNAVTGLIVIRALGARHAARLKDLAEATGLQAAEVLNVLRQLAAEGRVDVLEPLRGASRGEDPAATDGFWDRVFFRLRRPRDAQFRWQREIEVRLPVGRLHDVWQWEGGGQLGSAATWRAPDASGALERKDWR